VGRSQLEKANINIMDFGKTVQLRNSTIVSPRRETNFARQFVENPSLTMINPDKNVFKLLTQSLPSKERIRNNSEYQKTLKTPFLHQKDI